MYSTLRLLIRLTNQGKILTIYLNREKKERVFYAHYKLLIITQSSFIIMQIVVLFIKIGQILLGVIYYNFLHKDDLLTELFSLASIR